MHQVSSIDQRLFWVTETLENGNRIDYVCRLSRIPIIFSEADKSSKLTYKQLWSGVWTRISKCDLNDMFEANKIKFRFTK